LKGKHIAVGSEEEIPAELGYESESTSVVTGPATLLSVFHEVPTVQDLDAIEAACRAVGHPYCIMTIVKDMRSVILTGEARRRTDALAKTVASWVAVNALVVKSDGFGGAVARSLMAATTFMMRDHPYKVVGNVSEATMFVSPYLHKIAVPTTEEAYRKWLTKALSLARSEGLD